MKLPKLHLRDLFWLTVAVGLGLGWMIEHRRANHRIETMDKEHGALARDFLTRHENRWEELREREAMLWEGHKRLDIAWGEFDKRLKDVEARERKLSATPEDVTRGAPAGN